MGSEGSTELARIDAGDLQAAVASGLDLEATARSMDGFKNLGVTLKEAIGVVSARVETTLFTIQRETLQVNAAVASGVGALSANMKNFIVKACAVYKRGYMLQQDLAALRSYCTEDKMMFIRGMEDFEKQARQGILDLAEDMVGKGGGARVRALLAAKDALERQASIKSAELVEAHRKLGAKQGRVDSLMFDIDMADKELQDTEAMVAEVDRELAGLKASIPEYEKQVQDHRDEHYEERGRFWFFSWKVRDVHRNNGEGIARENLRRLLQRIRELEARRSSIDASDIKARATAARAALPAERQQVEALEEEVKISKAALDQVVEELNGKVEEIKASFQAAGTHSIEALEMVDRIHRGIYEGLEALGSTHAALRRHLEGIDADPDILPSAVMDALKLVAISDRYVGGGGNLGYCIGLLERTV